MMGLDKLIHKLAKPVFIHVLFFAIRVFAACAVVVYESFHITIFQRLKLVLGGDIRIALAAF